MQGGGQTTVKTEGIRKEGSGGYELQLRVGSLEQGGSCTKRQVKGEKLNGKNVLDITNVGGRHEDTVQCRMGGGGGKRGD